MEISDPCILRGLARLPHLCLHILHRIRVRTRTTGQRAVTSLYYPPAHKLQTNTAHTVRAEARDTLDWDYGGFH